MKLELRILNHKGDTLAENINDEEVALVYRKAYSEGDRIVITCSQKNRYLIVQVDDALGEALLYVNRNEIIYHIPYGEKKNSYSPKAFLGELHYIWAREATAEEIAQYKNLALNVMDQHEAIGFFPHVTANVETRGEAVFAARNAIDGVRENHSHGEWPYQSWGINCQDDAKLRLDFGRSVTINKILLFTRADFPHDNWWKEVTIVFSDNSSIVWELEKSDKAHVLSIEDKTIKWLEICNLKKSSDPSPFPALTQIEVYGVETLSSIPLITEKEIKEALRFSCNQILKYLPDFTDKFQNAYSENGFYAPIDNVEWTNGFWTGQIWLAYENCGDERLKKAGEIQIESFYQRIINKISVDHHDMGFLYSPSCVAGYKLIKSDIGKKAALLAADQLITRFHKKGGFIQAWGNLYDSDNYRLIIDCLLNLPLLYWAREITGNPKYGDIADKHIQTTLANVIRDDYSTWHTYFFNSDTGEPDHGSTCQGYHNGSAWARGQAWGIYGTALAYKYTGKAEYMEQFEHVTEYYLNHLPSDLIPYWDLEFTSGDEQPRDSSSASIAACGMLEMAKYMDDEKGNYYRDIAKRVLKSLYDNYAVKKHELSNGLVLHSTYSNRSPYNTCNHYGVDECNSWGDYFYMEALTRLSKDWNTYW